jgi:hypothetical protein
LTRRFFIDEANFRYRPIVDRATIIVENAEGGSGGPNMDQAIDADVAEAALRHGPERRS